MVRSRRYYERINCRIDCVCTINGREINGIISNISESGIYIITKSKTKIGDKGKLVFIDNKRDINKHKNIICFNETFEIVRCDKNGWGIKVIHPSSDYIKYIEGYKVYRYMKSLNNSFFKHHSKETQ